MTSDITGVAGVGGASGLGGAFSADGAAGAAIWQGQTNRIDRALVESGLLRSRVLAAEAISSGLVKIDGKSVYKASAKLVAGQRIEVHGISADVGRGAGKLRTALTQFKIDVRDRLALDIGASTGGFTQVLLEAGARSVMALDVGHDQLVGRLRVDPRVIVIEGCNARYLDREQLSELAGTSEQPNLIVTDVSFISVTQIFEAIKTIASPEAEIVVLVKPQFEVGKDQIGDGVVRDATLHKEAIKRVVSGAIENRLTPIALINSPILGTQGNKEFLLHLKNYSGVDEDVVDEAVVDEAVVDEVGFETAGVETAGVETVDARFDELIVGLNFEGERDED